MMQVWQAKSELVITSPYMIPGHEGVASFEGLQKNKVKVTVVTNSLAATDEPLVHNGYSKYRPSMLKAGVDLYELSPTLTQNTKRLGMFGKSLGRLHAKTAVIDRHLVFVGSMNLDPRSLYANTEIGVLVWNLEVARLLAEEFDRAVAVSAYRLVLSRSDDESASRVEWVTRENSTEVRYTSEPLAGAWQRFKVWFLSLLPIEPFL
jgi:cardiolipin synthase C